MQRRYGLRLAVIFISLSIMVFGCKGRVEKTQDEMPTEPVENASVTQEAKVVEVTEPAQMVATETIPPTAAVPTVEKAVMAPVTEKMDRNKEIQTALKNAGFYSGSIDGKIGPVSKKAIEAFQKAKGLKVDGKVGPKTWSELEKYLTSAQ